MSYTKRYWRFSGDGGRWFLSGADGAEPIAEIEPLGIDEDIEDNLRLIVASVNHVLNQGREFVEQLLNEGNPE